MNKYSVQMRMASGKYEKGKRYWLNKLEGLTDLSRFPSDCKQSLDEEWVTNTQVINLSEDVGRRITRMAGGVKSWYLYDHDVLFENTILEIYRVRRHRCRHA